MLSISSADMKVFGLVLLLIGVAYCQPVGDALEAEERNQHPDVGLNTVRFDYFEIFVYINWIC